MILKSNLSSDCCTVVSSQCLLILFLSFIRAIADSCKIWFVVNCPCNRICFTNVCAVFLLYVASSVLCCAIAMLLTLHMYFHVTAANYLSVSLMPLINLVIFCGFTFPHSNNHIHALVTLPVQKGVTPPNVIAISAARA